MTQPDAEIDFDWGGDGSNLHEPIRAHVEAALIPADAPYPPPLDQLLHMGDARNKSAEDARIAALGLAQEYVPDLVRMARDRALNTDMTESDEIWAPIHAVKALEGLDVREVVPDLIPLFDVDSDWFGDDLSNILGGAGETAIEPLRSYVQDRARWIYGRAHAASALTKIAERNPELRERVLAIFDDEFAHAEENDPTLNGFFLSDLVSIRAIEELPAIRRAFEQNLIDRSVVGGWAETLEALGQEPDPDDPLVQQSQRRSESRDGLLGFAPEVASQPAAFPSAPKKGGGTSKRKNKRKISSASRKANKGKRKRK